MGWYEMKNLRKKVVMDVMDNIWIMDIKNFEGCNMNIESDLIRRVWNKVEDRLSFNHQRGEVLGWPESIR